MNIIAAKLSKIDKYDRFRCIRRDGTETSTVMPRQGILPHDLIHYVVESELHYKNSFLGMIAKGLDIGFTMGLVHDPKNLALEDQAAHAEAIVERLQAQIWNGSFDGEMFHFGLEGACSSRGRPVPDLSGIDVEVRLYGGVMALSRKWLQVSYHGSLELEMPHL